MVGVIVVVASALVLAQGQGILDFLAVAENWRPITTLGHIIGTALGVGGATVSDFLFLRSSRDKRVSLEELRLLKTTANVTWGGLALLIVSGIGFLTIQYLSLGDDTSTGIWRVPGEADDRSYHIY